MYSIGEKLWPHSNESNSFDANEFRNRRRTAAEHEIESGVAKEISNACVYQSDTHVSQRYSKKEQGRVKLSLSLAHVLLRILWIQSWRLILVPSVDEVG
jgi:hypothetical protein